MVAVVVASLISADAVGQDTVGVAKPGSTPAPSAVSPSTPVAASPEAAPTAGSPGAAAPAPSVDSDSSDDDTDGAAPPKPTPPLAEQAPSQPTRSPSAVLRVLDKVTAETMAFDAPVGRRVRFKSLVFEVKACETVGPKEARPQPSVYLIVTADAVGGGPIRTPRQVFRGWMFANAPGVHALAHPVYDAWLVSCSAAAPAT